MIARGALAGAALATAVLAAGVSRAAGPRDDPFRAGAAVYYGQRATIACAGCHGVAGKGGGEGGIAIPALAGAMAGGGRYADPRALCRTLRSGIAPEGPKVRGRALSGLMPRVALPTSDCTQLHGFLAGLASERVPGVGAAAIAIAVEIDPRSPGQVAWRARIETLADTVNRAGGLHGRTLRIVPAGDPAVTLVAVRFAAAAATAPDDTLFAIALRGAPAAPLVRTIETQPRDEASVILNMFPGRRLAVFGLGDRFGSHEELADRAGDVGATIVGFDACGSPAAEVVVLLDRSTGAAAPRVPACPAAATYVISLRGLSLDDAAAVDRLGWRPHTILAAPIPLGTQFARTPEKIMQVIVATVRTMGRNPTRGDAIAAFDQAWRQTAARPDSLFAGLSLGTLGDDDSYRWREAQ